MSKCFMPNERWLKDAPPIHSRTAERAGCARRVGHEQRVRGCVGHEQRVPGGCQAAKRALQPYACGVLRFIRPRLESTSSALTASKLKIRRSVATLNVPMKM